MDIATKNKIDINKIRLAPPNMNFGFCSYGPPKPEIIEWAKSWGFKVEEGLKYTNILVPKNYDISECFNEFVPYKYVDEIGRAHV